MLLGVIIWLALVFLVAAYGKNTNLGYGGSFVISLFFSPLIGFIVAALSGTRKEHVKQEEPYKIPMREGDMLEYKGKYTEAIDKYMDAMYHLEHDYKKLPKKMEENRRILLERLSRKIEELSNKESQGRPQNELISN